MAYLGKTINRDFHYGANNKIRKAAKLLRVSTTECEYVLWQELRNKKLVGMVFRRQHPIHQFIVDFYCNDAKLVVEVDGDINEQPDSKEYDENRTFELKQFGLKVIRFSNEEVKNSIDRVLAVLIVELKKRTL